MTWFSRDRNSRPPDSVDIPPVPGGVLQVCHPHWRGIRSSAAAFGDPVVESTDLKDLSPHVEVMTAQGAHTVVIQGWPPNAEHFARTAKSGGLRVLAVFHSSPAQHGVDAGEAEAVWQMIALEGEDVIERVATVKAGVVASFAALGHNIVHLSNRVPKLEPGSTTARTGGVNVGIFLYPMWRKNVTTQVLAARQLGWNAHVMADPNVAYLSTSDFTVVGELPRDEFLVVQAAMDITMNVTLAECHPMMPMESYRLGVPCLVSRTSDLFRDDEELHRLTTVDEPDNPAAVADAATRLLARKDEAVQRASVVLDATDARSAALWMAFTTE